MRPRSASQIRSIFTKPINANFSIKKNTHNLKPTNPMLMNIHQFICKTRTKGQFYRIKQKVCISQVFNKNCIYISVRLDRQRFMELCKLCVWHISL